MTRTRIKCCGITRVEDARLAARLGVDAIGLVFTARSRRKLTPSAAAAIRRQLPPFVAAVALFMNDDAALVDEVVATVQPDCLQFHGDESNAWCQRFARPWIKAVAMGGQAVAALDAWPDARALLLDGHVAGGAGGAGQAFDWSRVPQHVAQPVILAGGLDAANVGEAVRRVRPWAVDVASGVEAAPGIKDAGKLAAFIAAVRDADPA